MLRNGKGNNTAARLNLIARCEEQRDVGGTHYLSHADMEYRTGLKRTAIIESNKALEDAGLIVKRGKSRDGVDIYSINNELVRGDDELPAIRANLDRIRNYRKVGGTDSVPGTHDVPGTDSEPLGVRTPYRGGTERGRNRYAVRTQTSPGISVKEHVPSDADAPEHVLFQASPQPEATKRKSNTKTDHEEHPAFARWWQTYKDQTKAIGKGGNAGNRAKAAESYSKALKTTTPEVLMASMLAYMASKDPQNGYNQHAVTWLNQRGWRTEWEPFRPRWNPQRHLQTAEEHPDDPFAA